jgi:hypothetical protein
VRCSTRSKRPVERSAQQRHTWYFDEVRLGSGALVVAGVVYGCGSNVTVQGSGGGDDVPTVTVTTGTTSSTGGAMNTGGAFNPGGANEGGFGPSCPTIFAGAETYKDVDLILLLDTSLSMLSEMPAFEAAVQQGLVQQIPSINDPVVIIVGDHGPQGAQICITPPLSNAGDCFGAPGNVAGKFYHYDVDIPNLASLCAVINTYDGTVADQHALAPNGWSEWLREDAMKVFVNFTDDGNNCGVNAVTLYDAGTSSAGQQVALQFDQLLLALSSAQFGTQAKRQYVWHSIVGMIPADANNASAPHDPLAPVPEATCSSNTAMAQNAATGSQWISKGTDGLRFSICETPSYGSMLSVLATEIANQAESYCTMDVPPALSGVGLVELLLRYTPGNPNQPQMYATLINGENDCGGGAFEYYFTDNSSKVELCPSACTIVEGDAGAAVDFFIPCPKI